MFTPIVASALVHVRSEADIAALFAAGLADASVEELRAAHLDQSRRLLGVTQASQHDRYGIDLPIRVIVEDALRLRSQAIVLAHNHPGGDPTPSRADHVATRRLHEVLRALDIALLDHVIFAGAARFSFRANGLL
jgi:DNA repair protein RadC